MFRLLPRPLHTPPHGRRSHPRHIACRHQQLGLIGFQRFGWSGGFRPPHKTPLGKPLLREPVALTIVTEETDRRPPTAPKNKHAARKRIFGELVLAQAGERIDAFASVYWLNSDQHTHLRRDLNHLSASRQARNRLVQSGCLPAFHWIRILWPAEDSNSIMHSPSREDAGAINSTNAGLDRGRRVFGLPA